MPYLRWEFGKTRKYTFMRILRKLYNRKIFHLFETIFKQ